MGCDAHCYVEYRTKEETNREYWSSFGGRINPGRNYWMFGLMAKGTRSEFEEAFEPKGLPELLGYQSTYDAYMYIVDDDDEMDEPSHQCKRSDAERWAKYGNKISEDNRFIEHPDWHTHSWLSVNEFEEVLNSFNKMKDAYPQPEYEALLAAMKTLEKYNNEVRLVFWFDN